jgi:hypothetical protein
VTDMKPDVWLRREDVTPRACDECGAKLWPTDWQSATGCVYCDHDEVLL